MIIPVVLSGGSGTRLWPLSMPECPKQFLALVGEDSLFRQTLDRVSDRSLYGPPIVVANAAHEGLCRRELDHVDGAVLLLEPIARNTAAAIAMAAELVQRVHGPGAAILVMPSDHVIGDVEAFHVAVGTGLRAARSGRLVTFGICPTGPETGYGYIKAGDAVEKVEGALEVQSFTEKPSREVAIAMLAEGNYFWNGGIFLYEAGAFLDELTKHAPDVAHAAKAAIDGASRDDIRVAPDEAAMETSPSISVDYAVMERSTSVVTIPLDAHWSDVGSWDALADIHQSDNESPLITRVNSTNCYVRSDGLKVGLLGVEDLLVVAVGDHVLVMQKGRSQDVKELAAEMNGNGDRAAL